MLQVFLPHRSFEDCARVLDDRRLVKQYYEAWLVYQYAHDLLKGRKGAGWHNHCIVRTWATHLYEIRLYANEMYYEACARGLTIVNKNFKHSEITLEQARKYRYSTISYSNPYADSDTFKDETIAYLFYRKHLMAKNEAYYINKFGSITPSSGYFALDKKNRNWKLYSRKAG